MPTDINVITYNELHRRLLDVKHEFNQRVSEVRQDAINASTAKVKGMAVEETERVVEQTLHKYMVQAEKTLSSRTAEAEARLLDLLARAEKRIHEFDELSASRALPERIRIDTTLRY